MGKYCNENKCFVHMVHIYILNNMWPYLSLGIDVLQVVTYQGVV